MEIVVIQIGGGDVQPQHKSYDENHDFINDPERPIVGKTVSVKGTNYRIAHVDHMTTKIAIELAQSCETPDMRGCDDLLIRSHSTQDVVWMIWVNEIKN